jgi:alpha-tubulin suppressor-like RCC1 family protein
MKSRGALLISLFILFAGCVFNFYPPWFEQVDFSEYLSETDDVEPELLSVNIIFPTNGQEVGQFYDFYGTVVEGDDEVAQVWYSKDGASYQLADLDGLNWAAEIELTADGIYTNYVYAIDKAFNHSFTNSVWVTRSSGVPWVSITSHLNGATVNQSDIILSGNVGVDAPYQIADVSVQLNGEEWQEASFDIESWSINLTLEEGDNIIIVEVTADNGKSASSGGWIIEYRPSIPEIAITSHENGYITSEYEIELSGTASIAEPHEITDVQYKHSEEPGGGNWVIVDNFNGGTWTVESILLSLGTNYISVRAIADNDTTNTIEDRVIVSYDLHTIEVWENLYDAVISGSETNIGGEIYGFYPFEIIALEISLNGSDYTPISFDSGGSQIEWNTNLSIEPGENNLEVFAVTSIYITNSVDLTLYRVSITDIAAGNQHTISIRHDGAVWAWGWNSSGQIGDGYSGEFVNRTFPVRVLAGEAGGGTYLESIIAIAGGNEHTVSVMNNNTVYAWGLNDRGQLGNNSTENSDIPVQVQGDLSDIIAIAAGNQHTVALRETDGTVWAWGWNSSGQLGNGMGNDSNIPVQVVGEGGSGNLEGITAIAAGWAHTVALRETDGRVWAWGNNNRGQLGDGSTTQRQTPVQVVNLENITAIAAGYQHTVALREDGTVWAWGWNSSGQLGNPSAGSQSIIPVQVVGEGGSGNLEGITAIAAGYQHTVALREDGTVWAWGWNSSGQLGNPDAVGQSTTPVQVRGGATGETYLTNIIAIAAGYQHTVALRNDGTVWAWGWNSSGQLGDGLTENSDTPVQVIFMHY